MNNHSPGPRSARQMLPEDHTQGIGKIVTNFQVLETWLRLYLSMRTGKEDPTAGLDFASLPVHSKAPINRLTDYATLRRLVRDFNKHMQTQNKTGIDEKLVDIRDALAHGRVFATDRGFPFRLIKFSSDKGATEVELTHNICMTPVWFNRKIGETKAAISIVMRETKALETSSRPASSQN